MTNRIAPRHGRRRWFTLLTAVAASSLIATATALAGPVGNAAGFEDDDGNLVVNSTFDWNGFDPTTWTGTAPFRQSTTNVNGWQFLGLEDAQATTSDSAFAGGTKQDNDCPSVITAKAPNKDDLKRVYLASKTVDIDPTAGVNNHVFLTLAWVRIPQNTTSPSAHIGFEFSKGETLCPAGSNGLVKRTAGDMLIVYDFEGGATTSPTLTLRRWVTSGSCEVGSNSPPCWGPATNLTAGGFAEGRVNTTATALDTIAPVNETLGLNEFGEAGVDLTAAGVFAPNTCEGFGNVYAVSRSSGNSAQAQMKDLVGPGDFNLQNCGDITIIKHTNPRGLDQNFDFTSDIAGAEIECTADTTPASFTLNDVGNTTGDSTANTETCVNVPAGSYTVTEGADPVGFAFNNVTCTVSGVGTSATTLGKVASITLAPGGSVTCVYVNDQQLGAIQVTKTRKHAASGSGDHPHAGVDFTVNGVTKTTDADGVACFDGLTFGTYTVHETVPAGYNVDANDKSVTVDNNAKCSDSPFGGETVSFHNTPLTDVTITVDSQVPGGTSSTIDCVSAAAGPGDDISLSLDDQEPKTLVCTIVIDP